MPDKRKPEEQILRDAMLRAMRSLLGEGYVKSYYEQLAEEFVQIAMNYHAAASLRAKPAKKVAKPSKFRSRMV